MVMDCSMSGILTQAGQLLFMGIPLTWWFPVNNSWKIKGNLSILCLVLSNSHNYFQNKTKQGSLDVLATFKVLPNCIFPTAAREGPCADEPHLFSRSYFTSSRHIKWNIWEKILFSHVFCHFHYISLIFVLTYRSVPAQTLWMYFCGVFWGGEMPQDNNRDVSNILILPE